MIAELEEQKVTIRIEMTAKEIQELRHTVDTLYVSAMKTKTNEAVKLMTPLVTLKNTIVASMVPDREEE